MPVGPRAEKFNIVSNNHGRTHRWIFPFSTGNRIKKNPQNCQFKLKFGTKTNSNMQNSVVVFTFFSFRWEIPFLGKFSPKNQNCQFQLKFGTYTNSNMQNSMVLFTFSVLYRKHPLWQAKVKKEQLLSMRPCGSRNFQIGSTNFYFVGVSVSVDCFCALP